MTKAKVTDSVIDQIRQVKAIKSIYSGEIRVIQKGTKLLLENCEELDDDKLHEIRHLWDGSVTVKANRKKGVKKEEVRYYKTKVETNSVVSLNGKQITVYHCDDGMWLIHPRRTKPTKEEFKSIEELELGDFTKLIEGK